MNLRFPRVRGERALLLWRICSRALIGNNEAGIIEENLHRPTHHTRYTYNYLSTFPDRSRP